MLKEENEKLLFFFLNRFVNLIDNNQRTRLLKHNYLIGKKYLDFDFYY